MLWRDLGLTDWPCLECGVEGWGCGGPQCLVYSGSAATLIQCSGLASLLTTLHGTAYSALHSHYSVHYITHYSDEQIS